MFPLLSGRSQTCSRVNNALLGAIALALLLAPFAKPSFGAAAVRGMIRDASGNSVPGAKVVLTEQSKHLVHTLETDNGGSFLFPWVLAGDYRVYVEKEGFRSYQLDHLTVAIGETATLAVTLTVGDVRTVLTVSAPSTTELDSDSNTLGAVIDPQRVQSLPLNGRNFLELALLAGGAAEISPANTLSSSNIGPPARQIILPGTLPQATGYSLNGFNLSGSRDGELVAGLSLAVVDQFKVEESFLMPDQGIGGASINVVTRTGSNRFHGQAIEFLRNRHLDARSFFAAAPEDLKRNQFGVALGGPIWPNRMWFYGTYEGTRELTAFNAAGYSPTQNMFNGEMAETGRVVYDPFSYNASSGTRQPFPGNIIPGARINPVSRGLLAYYQPGATLASEPSNIFGNPRNTLNDDQGSIRIDLAPTSQHQLSVQYFGQSTPVDLPGLFPLSGALYVNSFSLAGLEHTWTISSRAVNSFRAGFLRSVAVGTNEAQSSILSSIGIGNTFSDRGVSLINLQGYSSFGNSTGDVGNWDNTWQVNDELNYLRGAHQFAFGGGFRHRRSWQQNSNRAALGALSFQPTFTAQTARNVQGQLTPVPGTGDSFADFLLGLPVTGTITGLPVVEYRNKQFSPFIQDTWKIKDNLTLNYGVSWFAETPPDPQGSARSSVHAFDANTGLLVFSGLGQLNPKIMTTDRNNVAPRLGVAWKPPGLSNTVVRAGAGLYYVPFPLVLELYPLALGSPSTAGVGFTNPQTTPVPAYQLGQNIFPPAPANAVTSTYAANLPPGTQVTALDQAFRTGYISQWNLAIQHSLTDRDSIEISYLGSSGHRMPVLTDLSQCRPSITLFCAAAAKPWPRYGVVYWATSSGNTSSEQLIARYTRRNTGGLNLHFEYTLGKTLSDAWESSLSPRAQIADCRACDKGPATFDTRNRGVASVVWEIPYGRGRLGSGWSLSAITTFTTGQPILLTGPNQTNTLYLNHLPNRVCDGRSSQLSGNIRDNGFTWFDTRCFPVPAPGYFGNSGATAIYGPGLNNWDLGIGKATRLTEDVFAQLRVELFNAWNHPQFQQPSGNAGDGSNFGRISAARSPRLIQVALKLTW